jgi:hypothetical protein
MSMFDTALICLECKDAESARDDYTEAAEAERQSVLQGSRSFPGIGWTEKVRR